MPVFQRGSSVCVAVGLVLAGCGRPVLPAPPPVSRAAHVDPVEPVMGTAEQLAASTRVCEMDLSAGHACYDAGKLAGAPARAEPLYALGCRHGEPESCLAQSELYPSGKRPGDPRQVLDAACARGVVGICNAASQMYLELGPLHDPTRGTASLSRACAQADATGCLAVERIQRGASDLAGAFASFRAGCGSGNVVACREGAQLPAIDPASRAWLREQACFHDAAACDVADALRARGLVRRIVTNRSVDSAAFVGPGRHQLIVEADGHVALIDPPGRLVTPWYALASPAETASHGRRWIHDAMWGWDDATRELTGLVVEVGYRGDTGLAVWRPTRSAPPTLLARITEHSVPAQASGLAVSSDGRLAAGRGAHAVVFDLRAGRQLGPAIPDFPYCAALSADGRRAAFGFDSGKLAVTALDSGAVTWLDLGKRRVTSVSFHPTRSVLAAADSDGRVAIWNLAASDPVPSRLADAGPVLAFSPDGRHLALARDRELLVLDAATFHRVAAPIATGTDVTRSGDAPVPLAFAPDSRDLAIVGRGVVAWVDLAFESARPETDAAWFAKLHRLPPPAPRSAPVLRDGLIYGKVTVGGKPVAGAELELVPAEARAAPRRVRSGPDGDFTFDRLPAVEWRLTVASPDSLVEVRSVDLGAGSRVLRQDVDLTPGFALRGTVLDPAGRPAPGVRIAARALVLPVVTDRAGTFEIRHLARGTVRVFAVRSDGAAGATSASADGGTVIVRLLAPTDPSIVRLVIVDAAGKPVPNTPVSINGEPMGLTDPRGAFAAEVSDDHADISITAAEPAAWPRVALPLPGVLTLTYRPGQSW